MREREAKSAESFGILERIKKIEADLLEIDFVEGVEFDLSGFYDNLNQVIILTRYDIPLQSESYFKDRTKLIVSVIDTVVKHGLVKTLDKIEDYGRDFYFVFEIADKEKFYTAITRQKEIKRKITTEQEALAYIEKVLNKWTEFSRTHNLLKQALEIIVQKRERTQ